MDDLIRGLLEQRGATLVPADDAIGTARIRCLGRLLEPPIGMVDEPAVVDAHVWHAADGWSPLDRIEIERWMVDAPSGSHWLLSERAIERVGRMPERDDLRLTIWDPRRLAGWIGEAVLAGDLSASPTGFVEPDSQLKGTLMPESPQPESGNGFIQELHPSKSSAPTDLEHSNFSGTSLRSDSNASNSDGVPIEALRPTVDIDSWLERHGWGSIQTTPVLLPARIWHVSGILRGPEEAAERRWWRILEDPIAERVVRIDDAEILPSIPRLVVIDDVRWIGRDGVRLHLPGLCEVRRQWADDPASGSRLLHWWRLDPSSCEMRSSRSLLPAWIVKIPFEGPHLLHGLVGELFQAPPSISQELIHPTVER